MGSTLCKVFDLILLGLYVGRLEKFMESQGLSYCVQSGFKKGVRTVDNVFAFHIILERQKANGDPLYVCAVNFAKDYDSVDCTILLHKMEQ